MQSRIENKFDKREIVSLMSSNTRRLISPIIVLIAGVSLSFLAKHLVERSIESDQRNEFDKSVTSLMMRIQSGFTKQEQVIANLQGLYDAKLQVVRDVFELYSAIPAQSDPGILSIGYANFVRKSDIPGLELYNRSEGNYSYRVFPVGKKETLVPISYIVPVAKNKHLCGMDIEQNPTIAQAIGIAAKNTRITVTPVVPFRGNDTMSIFWLTQVEKKESGITQLGDLEMVRAGERFNGLLYVEVDVRKMLRSVIGDTVGSDKNVMYEISTSTYSNARQIVSRSANFIGDDKNVEAIYTTTKKLKVGDREFAVSFASIPSANTDVSKHAGLVAGLAGVALTLLLCGFLLSMLLSKERAVRLAKNMTASNRRILEVSRDIIAKMDVNGVWISVNPAIELVLGYQVSQFENEAFRSFMCNPNEADKIVEDFARYSNEQALDMEVEMVSAVGEKRVISWRFTVEPEEGLVYCNGRDVTDARAAEQQIFLKSKQLEIAEQHAQEAREHQTKLIYQITDRMKKYLRSSVHSMDALVEDLNPNDASHATIISRVEQTSSLLLENVSYLIDVARSTNTRDEILRSSISDCLDRSFAEMTSSYPGTNFNFDASAAKGCEDVAMDSGLLTRALNLVFEALAENAQSLEISVNAESNSLEQVTEVQILASPNPITSKMILQFNDSGSNLIYDLAKDEKNIMFKLGVAASLFRRANGTVSFANLGEDGNLVNLTLPQTSFYEDADMQKQRMEVTAHISE